MALSRRKGSPALPSCNSLYGELVANGRSPPTGLRVHPLHLLVLIRRLGVRVRRLSSLDPKLTCAGLPTTLAHIVCRSLASWRADGKRKGGDRLGVPGVVACCLLARVLERAQPMLDFRSTSVHGSRSLGACALAELLLGECWACRSQLYVSISV